MIPGSEYPLEEGLATHSSILVGKIPWTRTFILSPAFIALSVLHQKGPFLYLPESFCQDEFTLLPIQDFIHPGISELVVVLWIKMFEECMFKVKKEKRIGKHTCTVR